MTLTSRSLMWVMMVQHKTSDQYLTSGKVSTRSIHRFKRYRLLKTLTKSFNILSNADANAVVTATVLYLCTGELKRIGSKTTEKRWRHHFPHYNSIWDFCCHGNQSFNSICPKTFCSLAPTTMMHNLIKIGQLASEIFKFKSVKFLSLKGK